MPVIYTKLDTQVDIDKNNIIKSAINILTGKKSHRNIKELYLYLVFGLRSHTKIHNQPIDDYNDLVLEHKLCQDFSTYDNFVMWRKMKLITVKLMQLWKEEL